MFRRFFSLEWKAFFRSASLGKSLGLKIFLAFMAIYFSIIFLLLGLGLFPLLQETFPQQEPLLKANELFLIWLGFELFWRFMLQSLPVMQIRPLLPLPVKKKKVVNYVLIKSLISFFNFLPLLVILPFAIFNFYKDRYDIFSLCGWTVSVYALVLCVNFLNFWLKKTFSGDLRVLIPYLGLVFILYMLENFGLFQVTEVFGRGLDFVLIYPWLALIPLLLLAALYVLNFNVLKKHFYLDESLKQKVREAKTQDFHWLKKFGDIAPFLQLDMKLIWRNKRPRTTIFISLIIMGYGLIFYPSEAYAEMPFFFVFVGIFMTGVFMMNFGQFIPSWDASYFSMIMSQNIPLRKYLASKAALITFSIILLTLLTLPYVYFGWNILLINLSCALYNIGVNVPVLLFAGSFNRKRIDLEKSPFMNYQGTGAAQWLVALPLMVLPIFIFWLAQTFLSFEAGVLVLAGMGLIGIILRGRFLIFIEEAYKKNKYAMINGFKQTGA